MSELNFDAIFPDEILADLSEGRKLNNDVENRWKVKAINSEKRQKI